MASTLEQRISLPSRSARPLRVSVPFFDTVALPAKPGVWTPLQTICRTTATIWLLRAYQQPIFHGPFACFIFISRATVLAQTITVL